MAIKAQNGVMEFLLINHPLDCPICDQGGECQLQDLAVGYGARRRATRREARRAAQEPRAAGRRRGHDPLHPLHALRALRPGDRRRHGARHAGRGEHAEIMAFVGRTVDSELSGNMIDLCPVGALTSSRSATRPHLGAVAPQERQRRTTSSCRSARLLENLS
jgi:NADH-quinone oxidoreductase subunit G